MNFLKKNILVVGVVLLIVGAGLFALMHYLNNPNRKIPLVYSPNALLLELWTAYKAENIEPSSHRSLDKTQANITTSEGQSYTMLRAVWMDDKKTFDESWQFTKDNLQRPDYLLSWKFGQRSDGSYGLLRDVGGDNTASDADIDTALSLLMAYSRWNETAYLYQARQIIMSIWENEVVMINGKPVLTANSIERLSDNSVVVNPSYFAPYSFKLFSAVDPTHDWHGLADNSYNLLEALSTSTLGSASSSNLPPNWIRMDRQTGAFIANASPNLDTHYGYDALRIPFRIALDYEWNKDPRAKRLLQKFGFLGEQWKQHQALKAVYAHDGSQVADYETPAMYGGAIGYFNVVEPEMAKQVYAQKLQTLYSPDRQQWTTKLSYYDDNWAWFGIALTQNALPNLATINN